MKLNIIPQIRTGCTSLVETRRRYIPDGDDIALWCGVLCELDVVDITVKPRRVIVHVSNHHVDH